MSDPDALCINILTFTLDVSLTLKTYEKFGEKFISKIFSKNELKFLSNELPKNRLIEKIASGFAAKEAASKAIGTGFRQGISFLDFEIYHLDFLLIQSQPFDPTST